MGAMGAFLIALAYTTSCYNIMLPDLAKLTPTALQIGLYVSPVLWVPATLPEELRFLCTLNPMSYFIVPFRYAFFSDPSVFVFDLRTDMLVSLAVTIATALLAWGHRNFVRRTVVDYL